MKNKGFTLIELLAVIIILGILMIIAIPSVTTYINNSRKETYINTIREIIKGASLKVNSGELDMFDTDTAYYIPCDCIKTESGGSTPFGKFDPAYIVATFNGEEYDYYFYGRDDAGYGISTATLLENLNKDILVPGIKEEDISTSTPVGSKSKIVVLESDNCSLFTEAPSSTPTAAEQISALTGLYEVADAKRFVGANPDNYVYFNNNERWRIIGVYGDKLKIIKGDSPITSMKVESSTCSNWSNCILGNYLETTYYNSLSSAAKEMIEENGTWYNGFSSNSKNAVDMYNETKTSTISLKVGLIANYEYMAAAGSECANNKGSDCFNDDCVKSHWLNLNHGVESWTMTPNNSSMQLIVYSLSDMGCILSYGVGHNFRSNPVVYLKSQVKITGGNGTYANPYTLSMN